MTTATAESPIDENCFAPSVFADPHPYYRRLREFDPVYWNETYQHWMVTGYDEVTWLYRHPELSVSGMPSQPTFPREGRPLQLYRDVIAPFFDDMFIHRRPEQRQKRQTLHSHFTPAAVEKWRPVIRRTLESLLDDAEPNGRMEVRRDYGTPLPLMIIAEMMGIPEPDRPFVRDVSQQILLAYSMEPDSIDRSTQGIEDFTQYLEPLVAKRRRNPTEDLITVLVHGEEDELYTHRELMASAVLLLTAGHDTTINLICNGTVALIQHPEAWKRLRSDPEGMARPATEECLRWHPSPMAIDRTVGPEPFELGRHTLRPGEAIRLFDLAANRDPRKFEDPDTFRIERQPNPHLAFGSGIHHCLGAALARIEAQEAFKALAKRFDRLELLSDPVEYQHRVIARAPLAVEIGWEQS